MKFRLKALGLHLIASLVVLTVVLGGMYLCWYRWPGWYLADARQVGEVLGGVDLVLGPLLTCVIASPAKPRRVLLRDVGVIAALQLSALGYGAMSLWNGRPLYYAFSEDVLQLVQAYDIDAGEAALARQRHAPLVPHWYSLPRWIFAPLPKDPAERDRIVQSAVSGGGDVIGMPRYYQPWESGIPALRSQLKEITAIKYFNGREKNTLERRVRAAGFDVSQPNFMAMLGRAHPVLAVFDPATMKIMTIIAAD
jgi:hypothetical protein